MKTRLGFVSNSSSSSFVLMGALLTRDKYGTLDLKGLKERGVFIGETFFGEETFEFGTERQLMVGMKIDDLEMTRVFKLFQELKNIFENFEIKEEITILNDII
jgi:hypothetical protein